MTTLALRPPLCVTSEASDRYRQTPEVRAGEVAPFIFSELDALKCHSVYSIISSKEIASLGDRPTANVVYERFGYRAVQYFEQLTLLQHLRERFPAMKIVKKFLAPKSVTDVSIVHLGCGECQEQSTYAACRIASIFHGHILQLAVFNQHNEQKDHAFCLISDRDEDGKYFKELAESKKRPFSLEELATRAPSTIVIDPWIRTACEARSIKECREIQQLFADNGYDYLLTAMIAPYNPRGYLQVMDVVDSVVAIARDARKHLEFYQLDAIRAVDQSKNSDTKTYLTTHYTGAEWKSNTKLRKFFVQGAKEILDPIYEQLRPHGIEFTYSKVKDSADYVIIISYEEAGKLLKEA
ncbi:MAG: hypothetical protein HY860_06630 [Chlamydiales bacterium]|nr:hypothetical protein [Chlamydiales bacterium]